MTKDRWAMAAELLAWWAVLALIYLASLSTAATAEFVAAASSGLATAVLARAARRASKAAWRLPGRLVRVAVVLPIAVVMDAVRVLGLVLRPGRLRRTAGSLQTLALPPAPRRASDGRMALGGALLSATPQTLVIDDDPARAHLVLHRLSDGSPDLTEEVVKP